MPINQLSLLKTRRFLPLFITQFLGAFNDNVYKNALVILITYVFSTELKLNPAILITLAAGIFILPFFIFSALAGQLADKFEKSRLIRYTKMAEIILMLFAAIGFYLHSVALLIAILFLIGTQATFFGPMKYSILPAHLDVDELIPGNALLEAGTFLAILLGTISGGILATLLEAPFFISIIIILVALMGFITSLWIPAAESSDASLTININIPRETWNIVAYTLKNRSLFLSILGISWFWLVGATYLSQFPTYAKNILGANSSVVTLFLTYFTLGIGIGSLLCNRLLRGKINTTYIPIAALGMTIFGIDLVIASQYGLKNSAALIGLSEFLSYWGHWRILIDLLLLSICGGIYIVPLYAMLQHKSEPSHCSRAIASNNIMNALFMTVAAIATSLMLFWHFSVTQVFLSVAIANFFVAIYICNLLPQTLIKSFLIGLFKLVYRAEIQGIENYYQAGKRVLIVANHASFLDAALLAAFLPETLTFAINTQVAEKWWMKRLLKFINTFPIDPTKPLATKSLIVYLRKDHHVVIFPEGRITITGALMKIYEGPGLIADKADATILPIRIEGAQYTPFSYLKGKVKIHWRPKITLTVLKPELFNLPLSISGHERRRRIANQLYDIMTNTMFLSVNTHETLFESLLNAEKIHGKKHVVLEDIARKPMNYRQLILGAFVLGRQIAKTSHQGEFIGILLPNSIANVVLFFAMQAFHRIPAMLNFSTGIKNVVLACHTANIKLIYTSKKFIVQAKLEGFIERLIAEGILCIYLEDIYQKIGICDKLVGKFGKCFPNFYYRLANNIKKENKQSFALMPSVILFTSGSEGTPKGVALSHANLQSNRFQLTACVDFGSTDRIFNPLPMFHAFGLNSATLLPILLGMRVFLYPSPLHYRIIPELCYDSNSTILFGTDTFLLNYAKYAHPYNFCSIRYVFVGAEKLRQETDKLWMKKFGIRIFEGYGATEASPVLATNTPMQYKQDTVGRLLPDIRYRLEAVEGIQTGSRFFVSGPNIMLGYIFSNNPGKITPLIDGWHDTGDIVEMDEEGYITIKGRAKRFAKIAGEMVSLTAIEEEIYRLWPTYIHAIVSQPDPRKGEQVVLVTNYQTALLSDILSHFKQHGFSEIGLPRKIIILQKLPMLGSGKVDYQALKTDLI